MATVCLRITTSERVGKMLTARCSNFNLELSTALLDKSRRLFPQCEERSRAYIVLSTRLSHSPVPFLPTLFGFRVKNGGVFFPFIIGLRSIGSRRKEPSPLLLPRQSHCGRQFYNIWTAIALSWRFLRESVKYFAPSPIHYRFH